MKSTCFHVAIALASGAPIRMDRGTAFLIASALTTTAMGGEIQGLRSGSGGPAVMAGERSTIKVSNGGMIPTADEEPCCGPGLVEGAASICWCEVAFSHDRTNQELFDFL